MKRIITYRADSRGGLTLGDLRRIAQEAEELGDRLGKEVKVRIVPASARTFAVGAIRELSHERGVL